ncbi:hypothetical protein ABT061_22085 [Streptosporangium sp. NPDC002544]|uniref:hypothetical protein n=1 Tax=Streptosporangium sp. NPDC002544 TaxID=3154538 RepID=UPI00331AF9D6
MTSATGPHEQVRGKSGPGEAAPDGSPGGKSEVATRLRVPYVIAHAGEALPHPLLFVRRPFTTPRLAYVTPHPGDRADNGERPGARPSQEPTSFPVTVRIRGPIWDSEAQP